MKKALFLLGVLSLFLWNSAAYAFTSGSTGADGPFNPTANTTVIQPSSGILNYTTVNIPAGVTVTFQKNATNTPVYMLATGDVTIAGTVSVDGTNATTTNVGRGGPSGFDGGYGGGYGLPGGKGLGPGGGGPGLDQCGAGGGFGSQGNNCYSAVGGAPYGNARLLPLIGGSGGGGGYNSGGVGNGGGGGGAIVIASSTSINVTGSVTASGGSGSGSGAGGSGGGIKLVSNTISGNGSIYAGGGNAYSASGGKGRIRLETTTITRTASTDPPYSYGLPGSIFVSNVPTLIITSIAGTAPPPAPTGSYNQPDILLPNTTPSSVAVNISATNIPVGTEVQVSAIPQYGAPYVATPNPTLTGTQQSSTAAANVNLSTSYSNVVTAQATFTIIAFNYEGEEIDKVRVATRLGGKSETTYITKSGKEIKGELVAALMK